MSETKDEEAKFGQWAILELMGHVRLAGLCNDDDAQVRF